MWLAQDHCYECTGEPVALFEDYRDALAFREAFPTTISLVEVDTDELIPAYDSMGYEDWFNARADKALAERSHDCD
jgi:hypothetical protein